MLFFFISQVTPPENPFYAYGPLGVSVVFLAGAVYKMFKIIMNDRDKAVAQRDELLQVVYTQVLPAISASTEVLKDRQTLDKEIILVLRDSATASKEAKTALEKVEFLLRPGPGTAQTGGT